MKSYVLNGVDAVSVTIAVRPAKRVPAELIGLPESAAKETRARVDSALMAAGLPSSAGVGISVEPPQEYARPGLDLPIALAISGLHRGGWGHAVPAAVGELTLNGEVRPVRGTLAAALAAKEAGAGIILPNGQADIARQYTGGDVSGVRDLREADGVAQGTSVGASPCMPPPPRVESLFLDDVRGQDEAKAALHDVCTEGGNLLLVGPPGSGKTMLARRASSLLPSLTEPEQIEVAKTYDAAGLLTTFPIGRPFRAPHHTISEVGLTGGGQPVRPGEVSLAHHGVLFLDELPEFRLTSLDALRSVLKQGVVQVHRRGVVTTLPAKPRVLIAAANPCPCGYYESSTRPCTCSVEAVARQVARIDRVRDLFTRVVHVNPINYREMTR